MWKKIYCNMMTEGGKLHCGVMLADGTYCYVRDAPSGTSNSLYGFVEVEFKHPESASWAVVEKIVRESLAMIERIEDRRVYMKETSDGVLRLLKRPDIPDDFDSIMHLFRKIGTALIQKKDLVGLPE